MAGKKENLGRVYNNKNIHVHADVIQKLGVNVNDIVHLKYDGKHETLIVSTKAFLDSFESRVGGSATHGWHNLQSNPKFSERKEVKDVHFPKWFSVAVVVHLSV